MFYLVIKQWNIRKAWAQPWPTVSSNTAASTSVCSAAEFMTNVDFLPSKVLPTSCPAEWGASQAWGSSSPPLSHWHTADSQTARRSSYFHSLTSQRLTRLRMLPVCCCYSGGFMTRTGRWRRRTRMLISAADVSWCGFSVCFSGKMLLHCDWLVYSVKVCDFGNWGRWTYANDSKFQILKQLQTTKILGLVYHHCISNSNRELLTDSSLYWSVKENWPVKSLSHWVGPQQWTKIHIQTRALSTPRATELFVHVVSVGGWATEWFVRSQLRLTASGQRWSWSEKRKSELLLLNMTC